LRYERDIEVMIVGFIPRLGGDLRVDAPPAPQKSIQGKPSNINDRRHHAPFQAREQSV
jgi:hypothetical protein